MKKLVSIIASIIFAAALISCEKEIDSSTWISSLEDAKKAAANENKKIFMFLSADDSDEASAALKEKVFNTEEFKKEYTEKFVLLNIDYSNSRYEASQDGLHDDILISEKYNAATLPYFLILTKEGYVVTNLAFESSADMESARATFNDAEETIKEFDENFAKTQTGTTEERLAAIDRIFENTNPGVLYHLTPLNKLYLSLDKDNASGKSSKHLIALTYAKAEDFFLDNHPEKASEEFVKLAKNKILAAEERQMSLYTAGYLLAQSGSKDFATIKDYFQQAYDAAPETEEARNIQMALNYVQMMIDGEGDEVPEEMGAENPEPQAESSETEASADAPAEVKE